MFLCYILQQSDISNTIEQFFLKMAQGLKPYIPSEAVYQQNENHANNYPGLESITKFGEDSCDNRSKSHNNFQKSTKLGRQ